MRSAELIRYLVLAAQREGNRRLAEGLRELGLSPAQSEALRILGEHEPLTLSGLGEMLVCESGSNPSRLVDRLVGAGLVERLPGESDRRQVTLSLTEAGHTAEAAVRLVEEQLYAGLDRALDGRDAARLIETLQRFSAGSSPGAALQARLDRLARSKAVRDEA